MSPAAACACQHPTEREGETTSDANISRQTCSTVAKCRVVGLNFGPCGNSQTAISTNTTTCQQPEGASELGT
eukprot:3135851-Amphidinium_carterae.1